MKTILASKSPRRAKILADLGWTFSVEPTEADEVSIPHAPRRTVLVNAARKLKACRALHPDAAIVAADTIVWFDGRIYGKPRDLDEAREFLRGLSGQTHSVFTGVAFCRPDRPLQTEVVESRVTFRRLEVKRKLDRGSLPLGIGFSGSLELKHGQDFNRRGEGRRVVLVPILEAIILRVTVKVFQFCVNH